MEFGDEATEAETSVRIYPADMVDKLLIISVNGHQRGIPVDRNIRREGYTDALEVDIVDLSGDEDREEEYPTYRKQLLFQGTLIGQLKRHIGKNPILVVLGRKHPENARNRRCRNPCQTDGFTVEYMHRSPEALEVVEAYVAACGDFERSEFVAKTREDWESEFSRRDDDYDDYDDGDDDDDENGAWGSPEPPRGKWLGAQERQRRQREEPQRAPQARRGASARQPAPGEGGTLRRLSVSGHEGARRFADRKPRQSEEPPF